MLYHSLLTACSTAAWKPFASCCCIAVPCDWLAAAQLPACNDLYLTSLPARLPNCLLATYLQLCRRRRLPPPPSYLPVCGLHQTRPDPSLPPAYPPHLSTHHAPSQPSRTVARRLPASHRIRPRLSRPQPARDPSAAHPSLASRLPSRGPLPGLSSSTWDGGEPLHALLVTTYAQAAGPAGPEEIAPWTGEAHNAQGKRSTSRLTSSPTLPTLQASAAVHYLAHSQTTLSVPAQGRAGECAQSQRSVMLPQTQCHPPLSLLPCMLLLLLLPTSPHFTAPYPINPCTD